MTKEYSVIVSRLAARMLTEHAAFLAKVSPDKADRLVDSFEKAAESLKKMPHRCPRISRELIPDGNYRSLVFEKRYLIIYRIFSESVYIDYIVDCRQDFGWLLT